MIGWIFQIGPSEHAKASRANALFRFGVSENTSSPRAGQPVFLVTMRTPDVFSIGRVGSAWSGIVQVRIEARLPEPWPLTGVVPRDLLDAVLADPELCCQLSPRTTRAALEGTVGLKLSAAVQDALPTEPLAQIPRALSIRQPWAELIMRGIKTIEVRSQPTNVRARVYIYASEGRAQAADEARVERRFGIDVDALPRGVVIGTVEIGGCRPVRPADSRACAFRVAPGSADYGWLLQRPVRLARLRRPKNRPQPVWFTPF